MNTIKLKLVMKIWSILLLVLFILSCNSKSSKMDVAMEKVAISEDYNAIEFNEFMQKKKIIPDSIEQIKLIKSANVRFKVKNVKTATRKINLLAKELEGFISDQRFQNTKYQIENRFTLKVPQKNFDRLLDSIVSVAEFIDYQNITSEDVTEEYIDMQSRLKTKLEIKKRYETILRNNTGAIKDILEAEEKIGEIQEEIEAVKGRLNYLTNKVSFSTVQIDLYETVNYKEQPKSYTRTFFSKMKQGFSFGWNLVESIFLGLIYIWPILIFGTVLFIVIKKKIKK